MRNESSEAARQLGKLIAHLQRQWREELGGPEAAATAAALRRAQTLLTAVRDGSAGNLIGERPLESLLGAAWIAANPWVQSPVERIEAAIREEILS